MDCGIRGASRGMTGGLRSSRACVEPGSARRDTPGARGSIKSQSARDARSEGLTSTLNRL
jgi:hypothetical protein